MELDDADVRAILQLLDASSFDELQVQTDRFKLTLRRAEGSAWTRETRTLGAPRESPDTMPAAVRSVPAVPAVADARGAAQDHLVAVRSPLPGTFYRSPKPGAPSFVELGSRVECDTVVAIVETMKLMNSIYAGTAGRIAEICRGDAESVTPETVLMRIEPVSA